jgi:hypothetical protein
MRSQDDFGVSQMPLHRVSKPSFGEKVDEFVDNQLKGAFSQLATVEKEFVVNDTLWFAMNDRGVVTPCVVNSADYISGRFLSALGRKGWTQPKNLINQEIDAYIEIHTHPAQAYSIQESRFPAFFYEYSATPEANACAAAGESMDKMFARLFHANVKRARAIGAEITGSSLQKYWIPTETTSVIRIGLEFETGNIASSFRAINKLALLYESNEIDAGIFITSIDKAQCASRIWPVSNRNGSFEELENRNYRMMLNFPAWEYGFSPDRIDTSAPYLGRTKTYQPTPLNKFVNHSGVRYEVWTDDRKKQILRPP